MAEDRAWLTSRYVALEDVEVGAANRRGVDLHDGVGRYLDGRVRDRVPRSLAGAGINERFHCQYLLDIRMDGIVDSLSSSLSWATTGLEGRWTRAIQAYWALPVSRPVPLEDPAGSPTTGDASSK